ncbi:hypothetical protein Poli38472_014437 [Pythium oligandrum]|uniref:Cytochrome b5 heme-binding domain-containing protein n=1 Tax=Pythium oligandrum TaxID=41045 RepID=A0A8K1C738_PYTOL|nr:hypothetical protein Poli38472_014437 [Pythium oligandrum]|eukprot:TMW57834.1 hypothetical protein Poli38472_014437 [Pythium oligandrum]
MGNSLGTPPTGPNSLPRRGSKATEAKEDTRRYFTKRDLAKFNGESDRPIYIGLLGEVYDVTSHRNQYGPGGPCAAFAGKEASRALATMSMNDEDLDSLDLSDLSDEYIDALHRWMKRFQEEDKYPNVGRFLVHQDMTLNELHKYNGVDDVRGTVLIAINGTIYDVTLNGLQHYGPDGTYAQFAGHDVTRALACMSLDPEVLEDPHTDDLTAEQQSSLADWATRFQQKYAPVGKLVT